VPRGPGPHLLAELSSDAATCSSAPGLASLLRWAPTLPRVPWLSLPERRAPALPHVSHLPTSPPCQGGLRSCHVALASPPREESSGAAMYPMAPSGLWTTGIKKSLATLGTQLGSHMYKARSCVTEAPARRAVQPLRGHLSGPGSHCNYPALSYKRTG
jgi:hypothetical protein